MRKQRLSSTEGFSSGLRAFRLLVIFENDSKSTANSISETHLKTDSEIPAIFNHSKGTS